MFTLCTSVEKINRFGSNLINIADLQNISLQLAPIKPSQITFEGVETLIGQDYYHPVRPIEFILGVDSTHRVPFDRLGRKWSFPPSIGLPVLVFQAC